MKNKHIFIPLFVFLGAGLVSLIASIVDFKVVNKQLAYSSETIQFNYDGASDGKDPNGNQFNATDFLTDDIIEKGLAASGLDLKVEKVRAYITISNVVPKNIVKEIDSYTSITEADSDDKSAITTKDYFPVRYRFSLYSDIGLSTSKTNELLKNIVDTYCNEFYATYMKVFDPTVYDGVYDIEDYDYIYQTQVFVNKLSVLRDYARDIYNEHVNFTYDGEVNRYKGLSFDDLYNRCEKLIEKDVSSIRNLITLNALSKDLPRLKDYFTYKIQKLTYDRTKCQSDLDNVTAQLAAYLKDSTVYVSNGDTIITVETNSSATYDVLLKDQIELSGKIASIDKQISEYTAFLDNLNTATGTEEEYALVRRYLNELGEDYQQVEDVFIMLLEAYNAKYMGESLITKTNIVHTSGSLFSSAFIMRCIKIAAPIMLTVMLGIAIYFLSREIRKQKKAA